MRLQCAYRWCFFAIIFLLLAGCQSSLMKKLPTTQFKEQLYINAELNFAIKHPLNWERVKIPVSAPGYRPDTVIWLAGNPVEDDTSSGQMIIRSLPSDNKSLEDRLSEFLSDRPELRSGKVESLDHPSGPALKLLGHDVERGRLTIVVQGQQHDFIISLVYPNHRFDELLPIFQDIVDSFTEVVRPENSLKTTTQ